MVVGPGPVVSRTQRRLALVGGVLAAGVGLLAAAGLEDALVYYRTPSEVLVGESGEQRLRVGGLVVDGSLDTAGGVVRFTLTDGVRELEVEHRGTSPGVLQEGQGAIVEGWIDPRGVLAADTVLVKHSNEYAPA